MDNVAKKIYFGSNLNFSEVFSISKIFAMIPFNSPPEIPQFNGVMERSQGKIKRYLRAILKDREKLDSFAVAAHLSVERANRRRRAVLAGESAWERKAEEFPTSPGGNGKVFIWKSSIWRNGFWGHFPRKND